MSAPRRPPTRPTTSSLSFLSLNAMSHDWVTSASGGRSSQYRHQSPPLNSSRKLRAVRQHETVRRGDDNSLPKVQSVRGDSSAKLHAAIIGSQIAPPNDEVGTGRR